MVTKREIELETRETMRNLVDLILLMDTKIDMVLKLVSNGGSNETKSGKGNKKGIKLQD